MSRMRVFRIKIHFRDGGEHPRNAYGIREAREVATRALRLSYVSHYTAIDDSTGKEVDLFAKPNRR